MGVEDVKTFRTVFYFQSFHSGHLQLNCLLIYFYYRKCLIFYNNIFNHEQSYGFVGFKI